MKVLLCAAIDTLLCSGTYALDYVFGIFVKWPGYVFILFTSLLLNVCECTGKAESHPGRRMSSHSCLAKVL